MKLIASEASSFQNGAPNPCVYILLATDSRHDAAQSYTELRLAELTLAELTLANTIFKNLTFTLLNIKKINKFLHRCATC